MSATRARGSIIILYYLIAKYGQLSLMKSISGVESSHLIPVMLSHHVLLNGTMSHAMEKSRNRNANFPKHLRGNNNNNNNNNDDDKK